jgi:lipoprotein-anchoring transpeptidase ErfK/SrfK
MTMTYVEDGLTEGSPGGRHPAPRAARNRRMIVGCALALGPLLVGLPACGGAGTPVTGSPYDAAGQLSFGPAEGERQMDVDPSEPLRVSTVADDARITDVTAVDAAGRMISGELSADGSSWSSTTPLAAGIRYTVQVATENSAGVPGRQTHVFATSKADESTLDITFGPEAGTYGVGQPVTAELSEEIEDPGQRAVVERSLTVRSDPPAEGGWHWADDKTLHYRPETYWPAKAVIEVSSDLTGVPVRDGLRGGRIKPLTLKTGDRIEAVADIGSHTMTVKRNGEVVRTMPITTGKAGFRTRNGKKVILGKESYVRMRGSSVGIARDSSEYYDLDVYWAARLTWSGEYVHGAPWSVGSQGNDNVSHGCTGLSSANAKWFFKFVKPGDIVEHVNGYGADMDHFGNGFGDWNMDWDEWRRGSALHRGATQAEGPADPGRLRPRL